MSVDKVYKITKIFKIMILYKNIIIMDNIKNLIGKNVIIFDLETSGLPTRKPYFTTGEDQYYEPTDLSKYDSCRIVSIAYAYIKNFDYNTLNECIIKSYIRKPLDFTIDEENS